MPRKHKILIVDDFPDNVDILQELFEDHFDLQIASRGEECLEKAAGYQPDIVLLDIMMPGIDGHEVCRQLRASGNTLNTKIIFISAKAQLDERLAGYSVGADDYIIKPFEKDFVFAKVMAYSRIISAEQEGQSIKIALDGISRKIILSLSRIKESCGSLAASRKLDEKQAKALSGIIADVEQVSGSLDRIARLKGNTLAT